VRLAARSPAARLAAPARLLGRRTGQHLLGARITPWALADLGLDAFTGLVRSAVRGWGGQRACGPVCQAVFTALTSAEGVVRAHRRGLLRPIAAELGDLQRARAQQRDTEDACCPPTLTTSAEPGGEPRKEAAMVGWPARRQQQVTPGPAAGGSGAASRWAGTARCLDVLEVLRLLDEPSCVLCRIRDEADQVWLRWFVIENHTVPAALFAAQRSA